MREETESEGVGFPGQRTGRGTGMMIDSLGGA